MVVPSPRSLQLPPALHSPPCDPLPPFRIGNATKRKGGGLVWLVYNRHDSAVVVNSSNSCGCVRQKRPGWSRTGGDGRAPEGRWGTPTTTNTTNTTREAVAGVKLYLCLGENTRIEYERNEDRRYPYRTGQRVPNRKTLVFRFRASQVLTFISLI